eukprot:Gb_13162 [translate_table: standard]
MCHPPTEIGGLPFYLAFAECFPIARPLWGGQMVWPSDSLRVVILVDRNFLFSAFAHLLRNMDSYIWAVASAANATPMPLSHHIIPRVLPQYHHWTKTYGRDFLAACLVLSVKSSRAS